MKNVIIALTRPPSQRTPHQQPRLFNRRAASLIAASEILRIAGFNSFNYRGAHRQSIEMAIRY
jgi:hypothetical protein